jgi:ribose transport system permease protein
MLASATKSATPSLGATFPFDAITAVVLGGASLQGGKGTLLGTLAGVILVGVLNNLMVLTGIPFPYQQVLKGVILAAALGAQQLVGAKGRA